MIRVVHPGSGWWLSPIPDPGGSRGQKGTQSRIRIRNTGKMASFMSGYGSPLFLAAAMVHCALMSVKLTMRSCGSLPKSWKYFWPLVRAGLAAANLASACWNQVVGVLIKNSGNGDMATFASACGWSSPAMMGVAKAAGGFASLQGYSKQGVLWVQGAMCGSVGIYRW